MSSFSKTPQLFNFLLISWYVVRPPTKSIEFGEFKQLGTTFRLPPRLDVIHLGAAENFRTHLNTTHNSEAEHS